MDSDLIPTIVTFYAAQIPYCRPNSRGTGSAMRCRLFPAQNHDAGYVMMDVARQKSVGSRQGATGAYPTFDWENRICIKLGLSDIAQMIMVFRGMQETVMDGKGLFHRSETANTVIRFGHQIEPRSGYLLEVSTRPFQGELKAGYYFFTPEEAITFSIALEGIVPYMTFGIPREVPRREKSSMQETVPASGTRSAATSGSSVPPVPASVVSRVAAPVSVPLEEPFDEAIPF